ncbi:MAG: hypothetical protein A2Y73_06480 [Chloroflexi bacterium RBG_13_56_8]|nr:MAG: hypothetical protein A2Y73_06480 [Chloroflexi bacterium RBG_13_56_8]
MAPYIQGRLIDQGVMVGFEVDILGCISMLMGYSASLKTQSPYLTDWNLKDPTRDNVFLAWHVGNAPPSIAGSKIILDEHGMPHFKIRPGKVTFNRLVEYEGKFRMLISKGNVLSEGNSEEARYTWAWVEVEDLAKLYKTIGQEGFIHHASMVYGDYRQVLKDACYFLGIEVTEV